MANLLDLIPADVSALDALRAIQDAAAMLSNASLLETVGLTSERHGRHVLIVNPGGEVVAILRPGEVASWAFRTAVAAAHEAWIEAHAAPIAEEIAEPIAAEPEAEQFELGL